ncbi:TPA: hypothetical protein ACTZ2G_005407 [Bacillus cereus]|uniref:Uncharacterized protein n=1 Tax=Bacillus cereus TaxID=1396 RepID=A0A2A8PSL3_BACCE|nr:MULTISPECIES: hypothetical protein [Bacillus]MDV8115020.1 hypothetical protein [Bacillus sp. BAU-SS-2023]HDX9568660.1 hypothetical protein [Bacillus thuringiensis]MCC2460814.1 hypothetical protein [Bacillus mobilis]MCT4480894.1 hypothetical protein [Bacillus sp. DN_7.5]MCT6908261.1 hypothetical protein [Bacillus cereus]
MFRGQDLVEKLGYERWVLRESVLAVEKGYGITSDSTVTFQLDGLKTHKLEMYAEFGSSKRIEVLENLSPLLFVTCYKALDMIFEWILEENESNVPFQFAKKIKLYEHSNGLSEFKYPTSLINEQPLIQVFFKLYKKLAIYRNKIIHGNWGTNVCGDLYFSFEDRNKHYELNVSFKDILYLSEAVSLLTDELIARSVDSESVYMTIKFLVDKLEHLHGDPLFNISKPKHYKVEYELGDKNFIDIEEIRNYLIKQSSGMPISFHLLILSKTNKWMLPWNVIRDLNCIDLSDDWTKYKL